MSSYVSIVEKHRYMSRSLMRRSGIDVVATSDVKGESFKQPTAISILSSHSFIS